MWSLDGAGVNVTRGCPLATSGAAVRPSPDALCGADAGDAIDLLLYFTPLWQLLLQRLAQWLVKLSEAVLQLFLTIFLYVLREAILASIVGAFISVLGIFLNRDIRAQHPFGAPGDAGYSNYFLWKRSFAGG